MHTYRVLRPHLPHLRTGRIPRRAHRPRRRRRHHPAPHPAVPRRYALRHRSLARLRHRHLFRRRRRLRPRRLLQHPHRHVSRNRHHPRRHRRRYPRLQSPPRTIAIVFGVVLLYSAYLTAAPQSARSAPARSPTPSPVCASMDTTTPLPQGHKSYIVQRVPAGFGLMFGAGASPACSASAPAPSK